MRRGTWPATAIISKRVCVDGRLDGDVSTLSGLVDIPLACAAELGDLT